MRFSVFLPALFLAACSQTNDPSANRTTDINAAAAAGRSDIANYAAVNVGDGTAQPVLPPPIASPAPVEPLEPGTPGGLAYDGVVSEGGFTPDSAQGAANVLQIYYALIEQRKYREARILWDDGARAAGVSDAAFAATFDKYSEYHAQIGAPGEIDAGAGQRYVTVPVRLYGRLKAGGTPFHSGGDVTLHRVGDVDGASAAQKTWHIKDIVLAPSR